MIQGTFQDHRRCVKEACVLRSIGIDCKSITEIINLSEHSVSWIDFLFLHPSFQVLSLLVPSSQQDQFFLVWNWLYLCLSFLSGLECQQQELLEQ